MLGRASIGRCSHQTRRATSPRPRSRLRRSSSVSTCSSRSQSMAGTTSLSILAIGSFGCNASGRRFDGELGPSASLVGAPVTTSSGYVRARIRPTKSMLSPLTAMSLATSICFRIERRSRQSSVAPAFRAAQEQAAGGDKLGERIPTLWGHSSVGRALAWHAEGRGFEPPSSTPRCRRRGRRRRPSIPRPVRLLDGARRSRRRDPDHPPRPPLRPPRPCGSAARHHRYRCGSRASSGPGGASSRYCSYFALSASRPGRPSADLDDRDPPQHLHPGQLAPSRPSSDRPSAPPAGPAAGTAAAPAPPPASASDRSRSRSAPRPRAKVTGSTRGAPSSSSNPSRATLAVLQQLVCPRNHLGRFRVRHATALRSTKGTQCSSESDCPTPCRARPASSSPTGRARPRMPASAPSARSTASSIRTTSPSSPSRPRRR